MIFNAWATAFFNSAAADDKLSLAAALPMLDVQNHAAKRTALPLSTCCWIHSVYCVS